MSWAWKKTSTGLTQNIRALVVCRGNPPVVAPIHSVAA